MSGRLPTSLFVDATLKTLSEQGIYYYFMQKGNAGSGMIMLKLSNLQGQAKLVMQQRDFMTDEIEWINALDKEMVEEADADAYIQRAIDRDPDLWVIEIEGSEMKNPFKV